MAMTNFIDQTKAKRVMVVVIAVLLFIGSLLLGQLMYGLASVGSLSAISVETLFSTENLRRSFNMALIAAVGVIVWFGLFRPLSRKMWQLLRKEKQDAI